MGSLLEVVSVVAGRVVVFVVPGVVWAMLAIGLIQLARDGIRQTFLRPRAARLTTVGESRQAG